MRRSSVSILNSDMDINYIFFVKSLKQVFFKDKIVSHYTVFSFCNILAYSLYSCHIATTHIDLFIVYLLDHMTCDYLWQYDMWCGQCWSRDRHDSIKPKQWTYFDGCNLLVTFNSPHLPPLIPVYSQFFFQNSSRYGSLTVRWWIIVWRSQTRMNKDWNGNGNRNTVRIL